MRNTASLHGLKPRELLFHVHTSLPFHNLIVVRIDLPLCKLPCRDFLVEHNIQFFVSASAAPTPEEVSIGL